MNPRRLFWAVFAALAAWNHRGVLPHLGADALPALGAILLRTAVAASVLLMARAAGRAALSRLRPDFTDACEAFVLEAAAGLGLLHHLLFLLGLLGLWTPPVFIALLLLGAYPAYEALPRLSLPRFDDRVAAVLAAFIALAALKAVLSANAPVGDWDSLAIHMEMPRIYARDGGFTPVTWLLRGMDALAGGLFFVPALALGDEKSAAAFMLIPQGLMALLLWAAARRSMGARPALAAVALFLVSPAVTDASGTPGSDFLVGLFAMASFWAAWRAREGGHGWYALSGVMAGLAVATKISGFLLAAALFPLLLAQRDWKALAWWLAGAAAAAGPWLLRSAYYKGNPVWPYMAGLFTADPRALWLSERARLTVVAGPAEALNGAWPMLVPLALLAAASWPRLRGDAFVRRTAAYAGLYAALWLAVQPLWRYMIPLLPWLCLLCASWAASGGARAALLLPGFLPVLWLGANNEAFAALAVRPSDGRPSREAYLARRVDCWAALDHANKTLPPGAKILLYREVRGYHLERPFLIGDPQNELFVPYESLADEDALWRHLLGLGLTHVLVNTRQLPFSPALPSMRSADGLMGRMLRARAALRHEAGGVLLYELKAF